MGDFKESELKRLRQKLHENEATLSEKLNEIAIKEEELGEREELQAFSHILEEALREVQIQLRENNENNMHDLQTLQQSMQAKQEEVLILNDELESIKKIFYSDLLQKEAVASQREKHLRLTMEDQKEVEINAKLNEIKDMKQQEDELLKEKSKMSEEFIKEMNEMEKSMKQKEDLLNEEKLK